MRRGSQLASRGASGRRRHPGQPAGIAPGDDGNDQLSGGPGTDILDGGSGTNRIWQ
ncbi:hypothetical protein [Actinoplanes awajinensis]|uniref:hypothetical protein n=1 Tax=Actinoplanes awajinensis TaxID=135946 RepID=UPI000A6ACBAA